MSGDSVQPAGLAMPEPTAPAAPGNIDALVEQAIQAAEARADLPDAAAAPSDSPNLPRHDSAELPTRVSPSVLSNASSPSHKIRSQGSPVSVGSAYSPANSTVFTRSPYNNTSRTSPYQRHLSAGTDSSQSYAYHNRFYQPAYQYPPMQDPAFLYSQYPPNNQHQQPGPYVNYGYGSPQAHSPGFYGGPVPGQPGPVTFYPAPRPYYGGEGNDQHAKGGFSEPPSASLSPDDQHYLAQAETDSYNAGYAAAMLHSSIRGTSPVRMADTRPSPVLSASGNFAAPRSPQLASSPHEPLPYAPVSPPSLERGHLAQANLHNAVYGRPAPLAHQYPEQQHRRKQTGPNSALPKPPPHSDFALWIGNVPSDSSHNELWRFFNSRPSPASAGLTHGPDVANQPDAPDLGWTGVQSIHLIARSNCCFVNYASQVHLDHAIKVSHGVSLRPFDPRVKPLVCRVRKKEDDSRTGVGAQRGRGLHHQWAYEQAKIAKEQRTPQAVPAQDPHSLAVRQHDYAFDTTPRAEPSSSAQQLLSQNSSGSTDISNASTSSSFLSRHFAKRYFILKSHTEEDLELSVRQSVWATQSHNEVVLDQAYRTSRDGVFLIFSANKSGEFFGFAKMCGPITPEHHLSKSTSASKSTEGSGASENNVAPTQQPTASKSAVPTIVTALDSFAGSPSPMTPGQKSPERAEYQANALRSLVSVAQQRSAPVPSAQGAVEIDTEDTLAARRGLSLDVDSLANAEGGIRDLSLAARAKEETSEVVDAKVQSADGGLIRAAMTHNAKLEEIPDETESKPAGVTDRNSSSSVDRAWGRPFRIQWIKVQRLPFNRARQVRNAFNRNREVKISRDGTELDPMAGEMLLSLFFTQAPPPESPYTEQFSPHLAAS